MHNYKMIMVTIVFSVFSFVASSYGADVAKIGIVDFQKIIEKSDAGKKAKIEINKRGKELADDLKKKGAEIDEKKKKMEREALVMRKEMRDQKEREIRIDINDLKSYQKKYTDEMKQMEAKYGQNIERQVLEIVQTIGKKEGFLMILEKREAGVMYAPDAIDITDRVIQKFNVKYSQKKSKKSKK